MPPELTPWISPAIIVGFMLYLNRRLESRMDRMEDRLRQEAAQTRDDVKHLDGRVARLEHGQAKLEGLLEGLREAITRQPAA